MKTAKVNGVAITAEAVQFEFERLVKFYYAHGFKEDEIRRSLPELQEKALEQAIGAKLLLDRASSLEMTASAEEIDEEVRRIVEECHQTALDTLRTNRFKLHEIAHYLQRKETITGDEFMAMLTRDDGFAPTMPAGA